jgi:hypothetical protein
MSFFNIIFTCKYAHGVSAVSPDSPCILVFLEIKNSSLFDECQKAQFAHERVEYNVFLFDEPLKGSKSFKIFKISLTFRFDKL